MDKCDPELLLSEKNIRITRQRLTVLNAILVREEPFCVNDLHEDIKGEIDIVTIYRNLELLLNENIIREVMNKKDRQYFEISCVHNPEHPHFYCNSCGRIYCIRAQSFLAPRKKSVSHGEFIIHETVLNYNGICPMCRA